MKALLPLLFLVFCLIPGFSHAHSGEQEGLVFIENKNQWEAKVKFKANIPGGSLYLENNCFTYNFIERQSYLNARGGHGREPVPGADFIKAHCLRTSFLGSNPSPEIHGKHAQDAPYSYFIGNDPSKWASGAKGYEKVVYNNLYPDINLAVYSQSTNLKYDFIIKPGGNPDGIAVKYEGAEKLSLKNGSLIIKISFDELVEQKPYAYQLFDGREKEVPCRFVLKNNVITYSFPEGYDKNVELVIDPVLIFSTYSGSTADNFGFTATFDAKGYLYAASTAFANGYPTTPGAYQLQFAGGALNNTVGTDIAITKYDTTGTFRIYSTYLGGAADEMPHSLVVNSNNELFILGTTGSANFPTPNGYDKTFNGGTNLTLGNLGVRFPNGSDIFVSRLSSNGTQLLASTYLGGTGNDGLTSGGLRYNYADEVRGEIDIDAQNNIYVVSCTGSNNFPMVGGAFQSTYGGGDLDGIVVKMDNGLSNIIWSSYLGGSNADAAYSLAIESTGDLVVAGGTTSVNFPMAGTPYKNAFQGGLADGFIAKISSNGTLLKNATYFGTGSYDQIYFVELDRQDNVYVFGQTEHTGSQFIHNVVFSQTGGGQFVSKLATDLDVLTFSTAFGTFPGRPNISPTAFLVDVCNKMYLAGWGGAINSYVTNNSTTTSGLPITSNAFQSTTDGSDFYLMVLEDDASALHYGTFFGGSTSREHVDGGTSRFDKKGRIYQTACACAFNGVTDFPVHPSPGAVSTTNKSTNCNSAAFIFNFEIPMAIADFKPPQPACIPATIEFENWSKSSPSANFFWDFGDNTTSTQFNPTHVYTTAGVYNITLIVSDPNSCNSSDTIVKQLVLLSNSSYDLPADTICHQGTVQIGLSPVNAPAVSYAWSPPAGLSATNVPNPFATLSSSSQYQLLLSNGVCFDTIRQWVHVIPKFISTTPDTFVCGPSQVNLSATTNGLYPVYQWSSNPAFTNTLNPNPSDSTLSTNISASQVFYVKADLNGCVVTDSVSIDFYSTTVAVLPTVVICEGDSIGIGPNPQPGLVYNWSPPTGLSDISVANPAASPFTGTNYILTVFDGFCTDTLYQTVDVTPMPFLSTTQDTTICKGSSITLSASTGGAYQNYVWSNFSTFGDTLNSPTTNNSVNVGPGANQYFYIKSFMGNCFVLDSVFVTVLKDTTYSIADLYLCDKLDSVQLGQGITIDPNLSYSWQPPTGLSSASIANPKASPFQTTSYTLIVSNGICYDSVYQNLQVVKMELSTSNDTLICDSGPIIARAFSNGSSSDYQWSQYPDFSAPLNASPLDSIIPFVPGYGVNILFVKTTSFGCTKYDTVKIESRPVVLNQEYLSLCYGDTTTLTAVPVYADPLAYKWISPTGMLIPTTGPIINVGPTQLNSIYRVDGENAYGCKGSGSFNIAVSQLQSNQVGASAGKEVLIKGESVELSATPASGYRVLWWPPETVANPASPNTTAIPEKSMTYYLTVSDSSCMYIDSVSVVVYEINCADPHVFVPNTFTPNNDGNNDVLYVRGLFVEKMNFVVFNRWGEKVFETDDQRIGWDGYYKGMEADPGVFVFHLYAKCIDGQEFTKKGNVTLIR